MDISIFAETNARNQRKRFGIKQADRFKHMYIIGKTGMGKTTLEENLAIQDIQNDRGVAIVDPHGEFAEKMLDFVPEHRIKDVIYFNPADLEHPIAFNVLECVDVEHRHLVADGIMGVFKKIWEDLWSARMEYILNNTVLALLEYPDATLLGINRMLSDKDYRKNIVDNITDPSIKAFWLNEFAKYPDRFREEAVAPIQNKVGQFVSAPLIRNIIGQTESSINIRDIMDEGKILILNLSKGKIGEDASRLLGALIITKLQLAAMSRVDVPEEKRREFFLYVDEFQNFATASFASILSEARKYRLALTLAHQYIAQMDEKVRDAVFGNMGTLITFRVGAADAEYLEKELAPAFTADDLVNLGFANIYIKLMIDGIASRPFSATTLPPFPYPEKNFRKEIIEVSRKNYGTSRKEVEDQIAKWSQVVQVERREKEQETEKQLHDAVCWECGAPTKVIFEPDGKRPVYCKKCLKQKQEQIEDKSKKKSISLEEAAKSDPQSFKKQRKEPDIQGLRELLKDVRDYGGDDGD